MQLNFFKFYHSKFQNPKTRKWVILVTILYLFSPIDLIPDFLLPFGFIDDTALLVMFTSELWALYKKPRKKVDDKNKD